MRRILNLFRVRNIVLLFAVGLIPLSIKNFGETFADFKELTPHKGILEDKFIDTEDRPNHNSITTLKIKLLNDESVYSVSFQAQGAYNIMYIGDSIELYIKRINDKKGNEINGDGSYWYSTDSNQVFHIISKRFTEPIIDFKEYNKGLKWGAWIPLFLSIICFIWYFILRRNIKTLLLLT